MELTGRTVLLTGATGGIGHAIARALHARGARLSLTGRRADVLEPLAAEISAESIPTDLADPVLVEALAGRCSDVDVLVANAGLSSSGNVETFSAEQLERAVRVNLLAPMHLARVLAPAMAARGGGHIVFVSSLSGMTGQAGSAIYSATKFGLRGFAQSLRAELRGRGVGVTTVLPGFVRDAGMFANSGAKVPWYLGTSSPQDVAGAVVRGIERDRGEILVAPPIMRAMTHFAASAPGAAARIARIAGGERVTAKVTAQLEATQPRD